MKKVLWEDTQLAALTEMIDLQGLVEDYLQSMVLNLLYSASTIVSSAVKPFKVLEDSPASGSVVVPAFSAVQGGNIITTVQTTINVFAGTVSPVSPGIEVKVLI